MTTTTDFAPYAVANHLQQAILRPARISRNGEHINSVIDYPVNKLFNSMNETNWVQNKPSSVTENDRKNLEKAHKYEKKLRDKGYRWVSINDHTKIFVECDKNGNPTDFGLEKIKKAKISFGITK